LKYTCKITTPPASVGPWKFQRNDGTLPTLVKSVFQTYFVTTSPEVAAVNLIVVVLRHDIVICAAPTGFGVGLGVGFGVGLGVGCGVGCGVDLGVGRGVGLGVGLGLGDGLGDGDGDGDGLGEGLGEGDSVGVGSGLGVGLGDAVGDGSTDADMVGEGVGGSVATAASCESAGEGVLDASPNMLGASVTAARSARHATSRTAAESRHSR